MRILFCLVLMVLNGCIVFTRGKLPDDAPKEEVTAFLQQSEQNGLYPPFGGEATTRLEGVELRALQVALLDFWSKVPRVEREGVIQNWDADFNRCVSRLENYAVRVTRQNNLTFIHLLPEHQKYCPKFRDVIILDFEFWYAINDNGEIVWRDL